MICLFHLLHFSRFINKTDIRVHKPTSLNMVLIQEVEWAVSTTIILSKIDQTNIVELHS